MYFIPCNNKIYHFIAHMSSIRCYLLTLSILCGVITLWLYGIYHPLKMQLIAYDNEIKQLVSQQEEYFSSLEKIKELTENNTSLQTDFFSYKNSGQTEDFLQRQLLYVLEQAQKSDVNITSYTHKKENSKKWYRKNKARIVVHGKKQNIMQFLHELQMSEKMITVSNPFLSLNENSTFQFRCDLGFIVIK